jgi:hypothetical protein
MSRRLSVHKSIAELTSRFYSAFTNSDGHAPVDRLYDICLGEALIVNATDEEPAIYTLREFVEPRNALAAMKKPGPSADCKCVVPAPRYSHSSRRRRAGGSRPFSGTTTLARNHINDVTAKCAAVAGEQTARTSFGSIAHKYDNRM